MCKKQENITTMIDINPTTSIITLNINGLTIPIKKQMREQVKIKIGPIVCYHKKPILKNKQI